MRDRQPRIRTAETKSVPILLRRPIRHAGFIGNPPPSKPCGGPKFPPLPGYSQSTVGQKTSTATDRRTARSAVRFWKRRKSGSGAWSQAAAAPRSEMVKSRIARAREFVYLAGARQIVADNLNSHVPAHQSSMFNCVHISKADDHFTSLTSRHAI